MRLHQQESKPLDAFPHGVSWCKEKYKTMLKLTLEKWSRQKHLPEELGRLTGTRDSTVSFTPISSAHGDVYLHEYQSRAHDTMHAWV